VGRPPTEDDLVRRARGGDGDAYGQLVRQHQEMAFRTAFLITADRSDAEDATQEAFVKAHGAIARFRVGQPFRPWLLTIVANEARNRRRSTGRRQDLLRQASAEHGVDDGALLDPTPESALLTSERRRHLIAALDSLDLRDRQVIVCRHVLDLSERESANVLGCRPGTVKSRLSRALARLRSRLEDEAARND